MWQGDGKVCLSVDVPCGNVWERLPVKRGACLVSGLESMPLNRRAHVVGFGKVCQAIDVTVW